MPLAKTKFWHWDRNIRTLSAQAFGNLIPLFSGEQFDTLVVQGYLPTLFKKAIVVFFWRLEALLKKRARRKKKNIPHY
tara:strand:+ start:522 stop:755 length:234 start_codon:yes stop_codon:yes gene_type:complete